MENYNMILIEAAKISALPSGTDNTRILQVKK